MNAFASFHTGAPGGRHGRDRELVLNALEHAGKPFGAYELLERLPLSTSPTSWKAITTITTMMS